MDARTAMYLPHILSAEQFTRQECAAIFRAADEFREGFAENNHFWRRSEDGQRYDGKAVVGLFYQPSTRTRFSFSQGAQHLGMRTDFTDDARNTSSEYKGEVPEHTGRVISSYHCDIIVVRHHEKGGVGRIASQSSIPVINAGDGRGEHPTQVLSDLYTISRLRGMDRQLDRLKQLTVAIIGDQDGRVANSLKVMLADYVGRIICVSPDALRTPEEVKQCVARKGMTLEETSELDDALRETDVAYCLRLQSEQRSGKENAALALTEADYISTQMTPARIGRMRQNGALWHGPRVMHPMPINRREDAITEIAPAVDEMPGAFYFTQAQNGLYVRMALYKGILDHTLFRS